LDYISVDEARERSGLRLVLTAGVPGPWGEAAKALVNYKRIPWVAVRQQGGGRNEDLAAWTGQTSAPVAVYNDLAPACHWLDLLMLLERIQPESPLVPRAPGDRARAIGLSALVAGAEGYGWQRRLGMIGSMLRLPEPPELATRMARSYGYSEATEAGALQRMREICAFLDGALASQARSGSDYFVGDRVSAPDFYWASFLGMTMPLPLEYNPMPEYIRPVYECRDAAVLGCITPRLVAHRDRMYERHIALPLDF
jgi:glutathione S-transferase